MCLEDQIKELKETVDSLSERMKYLESKANDKYWTPDEMAKKMQCTPNHIRVLARKGKIESIRLGASIRIPVSQFYKPAEKHPEKQERAKEEDWQEELRNMIG